MTDDLKILNDIYYDEVRNEEYVKLTSNTLRSYEKDFIAGPFIDIGCGQSAFIVEHAIKKADRIIYGLDEEQTQLDHLKYRLMEVGGVDLENKFLLKKLSFPEDGLPKEIFSVIVLSNFLHFFTLKKAKEIINTLKSFTTKGSLIYVMVHSKKTHFNQPKIPGNNKQFKHFFSHKTLYSVFTPNDFDTMYIDESIYIQSQRTKEIMEMWAEALINYGLIRSEQKRQEFLSDRIHDDKFASIEAIFRRK